jgi:hypothetical protein
LENSELECPNCGANVYYELTRCPKCGWNFYDPDANEDPAETEREGGEGSGWLNSLKAVFVGWLAAAALAFGFHYAVSRLYAPEALELPGWVALFLSGPVATLAGGYLAGVNAKSKPGVHGLIVGILTIGSALLLESHWREVTPGILTDPLIWINWMLVILAGAGGDLIYAKLNAQRPVELPRWLVLREEDLWQDLLAKVGYDQATAERLIAFERTKAPQAVRSMLIQNAIERWMRDNR